MDDASLRYHSEMTVYFYIPECMHTQILTEIHRERKHEENEKIRSHMKSLEKNQDDNQKMYDAVATTPRSFIQRMVKQQIKLNNQRS